MASNSDWSSRSSRIRRLLAGILRDPNDSAKAVAEILEILEVQDRTAVQSETIKPSSNRSNVMRRNKPKGYTVEERSGNWFLCEYRQDGRQPYCCPQAVYTALTEVMARMKKPATYEKIAEQLRQKMKSSQPDYLPRVCMRFWISAKPPLIRKERRNYAPFDYQSFEKSTQIAWNKAKNNKT